MNDTDPVGVSGLPPSCSGRDDYCKLLPRHNFRRSKQEDRDRPSPVGGTTTVSFSETLATFTSWFEPEVKRL